MLSKPLFGVTAIGRAGRLEFAATAWSQLVDQHPFLFGRVLGGVVEDFTRSWVDGHRDEPAVFDFAFADWARQ